MLTAGIDAGMRFAKICLVEDDSILASRCFEMNGKFRRYYREALKETAASVCKSGLSSGYLQRIVATGYSAKLACNAQCSIDEGRCIAAAAGILPYPVKTVIDAGGLFIKIHRFDERGLSSGYAANDKCAAGSGRFLEITAEALNLTLDEIAAMDLSSAEPFHFTSSCAVFAESEVISQIGSGRPACDILAGVIRSLASKTASLLENSRGGDPVALTGGLSSVSAFVSELKIISGRDIIILPGGPLLAPSFGAALIGQEMHRGLLLRMKDRFMPGR